MKIIAILVLVCLGISHGKPSAFYYTYPAASSQTTVLRDALGNQATAYAYQDGHSSSVAVSRNDVSKHLAYQYVPVAAPAPVVYQEYHLPPAYHYEYPSYDYV